RRGEAAREDLQEVDSEIPSPGPAPAGPGLFSFRELFVPFGLRGFLRDGGLEDADLQGEELPGPLDRQLSRGGREILEGGQRLPVRGAEDVALFEQLRVPGIRIEVDDAEAAARRGGERRDLGERRVDVADHNPQDDLALIL